MLVLSRKVDESMMIDGQIEIQVLEITEGKVKLGIKAPRDIEILRKEVYLEIQAENQRAFLVTPDLGKMKKILKNDQKPLK
ncbi:MAG: carbon storage regulator CsrA [Bacillota bacterium]